MRAYCYVEDHDGGDEDRAGSVACYCEPWCGMPVCACGEDHGGIDGRCRDCDLDRSLEQLSAGLAGASRLAGELVDLLADGIHEHDGGPREASR